jgi:hypothetical protein
MTLAPPDYYPTNGTATLRAVAVSDAADGGAWTAAPFDPARSGWSWTVVNPESGMNRYAQPRGPPGTIAISGDLAGAVAVAPGTDGPTYRLADAGSADRPVAAIASRPFLDATGLDVGGRATVDVAGRPMDVTIAAATDAFAPLDPGAAFLVVDGMTLDADRYLTTDAPAPVTEWWLGVAPGAADRVATALSGPPFGAKAVVVRSAVERSLATDPVSLGVIGALGLGTLAALAFAAIGFVVNATVATDERLGELGILRALGVSSRQLGVWLVAESAVLLVVGVLGGAALGLLLAVVVLPFASLTSTGAPAVPSPVVVVPVEALAPIYASAAVLLVVAIVVSSRQIPPIHVSGVLRGRDE